MEGPDHAAAVLGASNCVWYLQQISTRLDVTLRSGTLERLLQMLRRRVLAESPSTASYLLIGGIAQVLGDVRHRTWLVPLEDCQLLQLAAAHLGKAAAFDPLIAAGGQAAGAGALAAFVISCSVLGMLAAMVSGHAAEQRHRVHPAVWDRFKEEASARVTYIQVARMVQQHQLVDLLLKDGVQTALLQGCPEGLLAASTDVLLCKRGSAAADAVWCASAAADLLGSDIATFRESSDAGRLISAGLIEIVAASLLCLTCGSGAAILADCSSGFKSLHAEHIICVTAHVVRASDHLVGACSWMRLQLMSKQGSAPHIPQPPDWTIVLSCSGSVTSAMLRIALRWGRTGCWDDVPSAGKLRGGWLALAQNAAALLHTITAQPTDRRADALRQLKVDQAALALQRMLAWVAESPAIATTTSVLTEGLQALAAIARADAESSQQLAIRGGPHEWAPVAEALHRRLPRRMAARLLPMVDAVTAALARAPTAGEKDAAAAADAAMVALLLVSPIA